VCQLVKEIILPVTEPEGLLATLQEAEINSVNLKFKLIQIKINTVLHSWLQLTFACM
jgi:hypothetical protein